MLLRIELDYPRQALILPPYTYPAVLIDNRSSNQSPTGVVTGAYLYFNSYEVLQEAPCKQFGCDSQVGQLCQMVRTSESDLYILKDPAMLQ